jgi:hypothetical protein
MKSAIRIPEALVVRLGFAAQMFCYAGSITVMIVVLYRLPSFVESRRDILFGTLLVACMSLLLALIGLVILLTTMTYRVMKRGDRGAVGEGR